MSEVPQIHHNSKKGFTIPELVVYIGIMTIALVSVVTLLVNSARIMQEVSSEKEVRMSALTALERISREVKGAEAIVLSESVFGDEEGSLSIFTRSIDNEPRKVTFQVNESDEIEILYDDVSAGELTTPGVTVDSFALTHLTHGGTESVRIELVLYPKGQADNTTTFYSTAVLRGLY